MRRSTRSLRLLLSIVSGVTALAACKGEVRSPDASLDAVAPTVVCGAQRATAVALSGSGFTPLTLGALGDAPHIELPKVLLQLRSRADGSGGDGVEIAVPDGT